jgi:hypothetical protein
MDKRQRGLNVKKEKTLTKNNVKWKKRRPGQKVEKTSMRQNIECDKFLINMYLYGNS